jgi:hypothetical protein
MSPAAASETNSACGPGSSGHEYPVSPGDTSTSALTRDGWLSARSMELAPPWLQPTKTAGGTSS